MNPHLIKKFFPNASKSVLAANAADYGTGQPDLPASNARKTAKLEQSDANALHGAAPAKAPDRQRFLVRITTIRKRLLDEDNLCGKFHCDLLRYAGVIPSDAPAYCKIETLQRQCVKGQPEEIVIEVFTLSDAT